MNRFQHTDLSGHDNLGLLSCTHSNRGISFSPQISAPVGVTKPSYVSSYSSEHKDSSNITREKMPPTCTSSISEGMPQAPPMHMNNGTRYIAIENSTGQQYIADTGNIVPKQPIPSYSKDSARPTNLRQVDPAQSTNLEVKCIGDDHSGVSNSDDSSDATMNKAGRNLAEEFEKMYVEEKVIRRHDDIHRKHVLAPKQLTQSREGEGDGNNENTGNEKMGRSIVERDQPEDEGSDDKIASLEKKSLISPSCVIEGATCLKNADGNDLFPDGKDDSSNFDDMSKEDLTLSTMSVTESSVHNQRVSTENTPTKIKSISMPDFYLHTDLRRNLSQHQVNRISFYSVVHDVNKEATAMASNDRSAFESKENDSVLTIPSSLQQNDIDDDTVDEGKKDAERIPATTAIIDEEYWLLSAIASRSPEESLENRACPPTLSEALGEEEPKDTSDPLAQAECRTQLWKPSRSWWEARSGKNPWIEPRSHNKRWRYLWPLIHYHKFIARCIKKLKRNGVDVKSSQSPVSVFLREEVCAVSDHLASVSKFTAEEWLRALAHFHGWTDTTPIAEACLRQVISQQKLRSMTEPTDVQSPLLKDQIDEHFLKAMAAARLQMQEGKDEVLDESLPYNQSLSTAGNDPNFVHMYHDNSYNYPPGQATHPQNMQHMQHHPKMWPKIPKAPGQHRSRGPRGRHGNNNSRYQYNRRYSGPHAMSNNSHMHGNYHHNHQYHHMYHHSMHNGMYGGGPYGPPPPMAGSQYPHPHQYWPHPPESAYYHYNGYNGAHYAPYADSMHPYSSDYINHPPPITEYHNPHAETNDGDLHGMSDFTEQHARSEWKCGEPEGRGNAQSADEPPATPGGAVPTSPCWAHLEQVGYECLATPQHAPSPYHRNHHGMPTGRGMRNQSERSPYMDKRRGYYSPKHAKPLLFNPSIHYYRQPGRGITPPSPATQFLMAGSGWGSPPNKNNRASAPTTSPPSTSETGVPRNDSVSDTRTEVSGISSASSNCAAKEEQAPMAEIKTPQKSGTR